MQSLSLESLPVVGALHHDVTTDGVAFRRLPAWTRHQIVDPALELMVTMPAGVRLEFVSDAREIELDVMLTLVQLGDLTAWPAAFDLVVGGRVRASLPTVDGTRIIVDPRTGGVEIVPGEPTTIRFDGLPADDSTRVELWLPQSAALELRGVRISTGATLQPAPRAGRRWAHYGSSISHCLEATQPTGTWPAVAARKAGVDLVNLAVAGQCMLDQHVARTIRDLDIDCLSVKAGINVVNGDTMRERTYVPALHGFLDTVRDGHPTTPIAVVTPIICPEAEDHPGPTTLGSDSRFLVVPRPAELATGALTLGRIRTLMAEVVQSRQAAGDDNLHLVDGLALFGPADLDDLPDGLHPNATGYRRMGERFHDLVFAMSGPFAPSN